MKKLKKILLKIYWIVVILFLSYFVVSYIDVLIHNLNSGSNWKFNYFYILANLLTIK